MNEYLYHAGTNQRIGVMLRDDKSLKLEAHGNKGEGYAAFLVWSDGTALRISYVYRSLRDLKDAAWRAYQCDATAKRNSFHGVL